MTRQAAVQSNDQNGLTGETSNISSAIEHGAWFAVANFPSGQMYYVARADFDGFVPLDGAMIFVVPIIAVSAKFRRMTKCDL